jgi:hypothetical protein
LTSALDGAGIMHRNLLFKWIIMDSASLSLWNEEFHKKLSKVLNTSPPPDYILLLIIVGRFMPIFREIIKLQNLTYMPELTVVLYLFL